MSVGADGRIHGAGGRVGPAGRRMPVTILLLLGYLAAGVAGGRLNAALPVHDGGGAAPPWVALAAYLPTAANLPAYLFGGVVLALLAGLLEVRMNSMRFLAAALATQLAALAGGAVFVALINPAPEAEARILSGHAGAGVTILLSGVAMAATAGLRAMWRRRVRMGLVAVVLITALYAGTLPDAMRLVAVLAGWILGAGLHGGRRHRHWGHGTRHEGRVLVAVLLCAAALGPVVAALSPGAVGPLAVLRYLGTDVVPADPATLARLCSLPARIDACAAAQLQQRGGLGAVFTAILPSILLVVLADGLRRGRRMAWWAAVVLQGAIAALTVIYIVGVVVPARVPSADLLEGLGQYDFGNYGQAKAIILPLLVPLAVFAVLLASRRLFTIRAPAGVNPRLLRRVAVLAASLSVLYVGAGYWLREGFSPVPGPGDLLEDLPERFLPTVYALHLSPEFVPATTATTLLFEGIGILFWTVAGVWLLGSFLSHETAGAADERARARAMLLAGTGDTFSWMSTWEGNSYWFAPDGRSFVAYRAIAGIALTLGNPVAAPGDVSGTVGGFVEFCRRHELVPCFYTVTREVLDALPRQDWSHVRVATETVLSLGSLAFQGKKFQDVRTALNRAQKQGVTASWATFGQLALGMREQLREISEEWVAERAMPEMGFTLGGMAELEDPEVKLLLAIDDAGVLQGATSWLPVHRDGAVVGWTLDFMRRRTGGFRPVVEFLIGTAALTLQAQGYAFASLSGAPLATAMAPDDGATRTPERGPARERGSRWPARERGSRAPVRERGTEGQPLERVLDWLAATLEPVYGFRSLMSFKMKFQPRFVPRYMVFPDAAALPAISAAIVRAYLGDVSLGEGWSLARKLLHRR